MKPRILVAGIGNIFMGDDAFGSEVARCLLLRTWPDNVRVVDFGIRGFDLTFALLENYDAVILLDATPRGGAPGTLYTIEPDLNDLERADPGIANLETHGMNPMRVLAAAKTMGAEFQDLFLVGCEPSPENVDPEGEGSMQMSDAVQGVIEEAANVVEMLVAEIIRDGSRKTGRATQG
ncbi:MAG TPA: hydrogenase maturation protease [Bryobacteraceae bacterium]